MKVTLDYFPGPEPASVTYKDVVEITTLEYLGYLRLVLKRSTINGGPSAYSTPLYLIKGINIEQENMKE